MSRLSVREYAITEGISLGTAYRRLWEGRVQAAKCDGRWVIVSSETTAEDAKSSGTAPKPAATPTKGDVHYER